MQSRITVCYFSIHLDGLKHSIFYSSNVNLQNMGLFSSIMSYNAKLIYNHLFLSNIDTVFLRWSCKKMIRYLILVLKIAKHFLQVILSTPCSI